MKIDSIISSYYGNIQNTDITTDPADSCAIYMTVRHATSKKVPALSAHCRFDDHIRCIAAKKNLVHKRHFLRLAKMATICEMLDLPIQSTGHNHPKALHYSKLTIVRDVSPHTPVKESCDHISASHHMMTSPLAKEEAIEFANKNDDGSVMLPFDKGSVEMDQLSFTVAQQSPEQQLNMFLESSSFSCEDQHKSDFDQRQQQMDNNVDQTTQAD